MKDKIVIMIILIGLFVLFPSGSFKKYNSAVVQQLTYCQQRYDKNLILKARDILDDMSLKEKVGQMFMTSIEALDPSFSLTQVKDNTVGITTFQNNKIDFYNYPVGGIVLFNKNLSSEMQLRELIQDLNDSTSFPMFIAIDEEGGTVSRIANSGYFDVKNYGTNEEIGKSYDLEYANKVAFYIGSYLNDFGINLNFAPVADINSNIDNPIIGNRSFGNNPYLVSTMINAQIKGFHSAGVLTTTKHYPGHGDTSADSHNGTVVLNKTFDDLTSFELIPFLKTIHQTDMIMVSHITLPNITDKDLPASLSQEIIQNQLRTDFKYQGVVITDALNMDAITQYYSSKDIIQYGINAGVDIFLMPYNLAETFNLLYEYAQMNESRINESVLRIIYLKLKYNIIH